ncbi:unnamed protein product [Cercospora beticola]|nr:unnamed protein product [Cercospora beticola]
MFGLFMPSSALNATIIVQKRNILANNHIWLICGRTLSEDIRVNSGLEPPASQPSRASAIAPTTYRLTIKPETIVRSWKTTARIHILQSQERKNKMRSNEGC